VSASHAGGVSSFALIDHALFSSAKPRRWAEEVFFKKNYLYSVSNIELLVLFFFIFIVF
jgi:hypothetical protein